MDARQMACQLSCTQLHKRGNLVHRHPQVAADQDPTAFAHKHVVPTLQDAELF